MRDRPDSSDVARALGDRLLVAVGTRDPFVPVEVARAIGSGADLELFDGAGHLLSLERPDAFNPVLVRFLEKLPRRR
jgi:pimeloyl-ACP methyl ester carboxylesterase